MNDKEKAAFDELDSYFSKYHCHKEAWQTLKTAVLAQQSTNKQIMPLMLSDGKCIMCGTVMDSEAPIAGRDY